jgi:hypothetical protein
MPHEFENENPVKIPAMIKSIHFFLFFDTYEAFYFQLKVTAIADTCHGLDLSH